MKAYTFILGILLICAGQSEIIPPRGWRDPYPSEINDKWRSLNKSNYITAEGDYNGDGIPDTAKILISLDGNSYGVFVYISGSNNNVHKVIDNIDIKYMISHGISTVSRGSYLTACGKGYWTCKSDEPTKITLSSDAINYFKYESANSFFYWEEGVFKRIWISD